MENAKCYAPQILVGTEGLPREQWLEYRRKGIGGSDAAAVLGISPFRTGRDLYYDKLNHSTCRIISSMKPYFFRSSFRSSFLLAPRLTFSVRNVSHRPWGRIQCRNTPPA